MMMDLTPNLLSNVIAEEMTPTHLFWPLKTNPLFRSHTSPPPPHITPLHNNHVIDTKGLDTKKVFPGQVMSFLFLLVKFNGHRRLDEL